MTSFHEPFAEAVDTVLFVNEDVAEVGKYGVIADDTCEPICLSPSSMPKTSGLSITSVRSRGRPFADITT